MRKSKISLGEFMWTQRGREVLPRSICGVLLQSSAGAYELKAHFSKRRFLADWGADTLVLGYTSTKVLFGTSDRASTLVLHRVLSSGTTCESPAPQQVQQVKHKKMSGQPQRHKHL